MAFFFCLSALSAWAGLADSPVQVPNGLAAPYSVTPGCYAGNEALSWSDAFGADVKTLDFPDSQRWTKTGMYVSQETRCAYNAKRTPLASASADPAKITRERAEEEVGLWPTRDTFLSPADFVGGVGPAMYGNRCEKRFAVWIYGSGSANPSMQADFETDPFPPPGNYELIISGQDDHAEAKCSIRIKVNDTVIFEGENPFVRLGWSWHAFPIPSDSLKRQNTLTIENTEPGSQGAGPPFFILNYAVVRKLVL